MTETKHTLVRIADLNWKIHHRYSMITKRMKDYIIKEDDGQSIDISFSNEELERAMNFNNKTLENIDNAINIDNLEKVEFLEEVENENGEEFAEYQCAYTKIGENLPLHDRILMHGAVISYNQKAYMFTAPSGTGKTTHISLWKKYLGDKVDIVNGDKPILKPEKDFVRVYGNPWGGKENWHKNCQFPLEAICLIHRGKTNKIKQINPGDYIDELIQQVFLPLEGEENVARTLELLDNVLGKVPFYLLECDISREAFNCSFERMAGVNNGR